MFELYDHSTSVCSAKVRVVMAEKRIDFISHPVDILTGEQFTPQYQKINPRKLVPALVHDGRIITESTVINEYLDDVQPQTPLKPEASFDRAQMRIWTKLVDEKLHDACTVITYVIQHRHKLLTLDPSDLETMLQNTDAVYRDRKRSWIKEGFDSSDLLLAVATFEQSTTEMNETLSKSRWLAGEQYSLADAALTPYINRLAMLSFEDWWELEKPALKRWFDEVRKRASFQSGLMDHIPAKLNSKMREHGTAAWPKVRAVLDGVRSK